MERPEFSVEIILEANDKLTRFYTGIPTYNSFLALIEYLEPKALQLRTWRGTETNTNSNIEGTQQLSMLYILVGSQSVIYRVDLVATRIGAQTVYLQFHALTSKTNRNGEL